MKRITKKLTQHFNITVEMDHSNVESRRKDNTFVTPYITFYHTNVRYIFIFFGFKYFGETFHIINVYIFDAFLHDTRYFIYQRVKKV